MKLRITIGKSQALITLLCLFTSISFVPAFCQQETVEEHLIVLLAEFPDRKLGKNADDIKLVLDEVDTLFEEASFNKLSLNSTVMPTKYMMPNTLAHYDKSSFDNTQFFRDLITMADRDINFHDSWLLVYHAGDTSPTGNAIHRQAITDDDEIIRGFARVDSTTRSIPVTLHELAHLFGNLPDLYDRSRPVGDITNQYQSDIFYYDLDIMGAKTHGGFSAYSRIKLGWFDDNVLVVKPGEDKRVMLTPVESCNDGICAVQIPVNDERYYLIESREIISKQDQALQPKFEGITITYVDESIPSGRGPVKLLNINGYSTQFFEKHAYNTDSLFISPDHGFMLTAEDDNTIRIKPAENVSYYKPKELKIVVNDFLGRTQEGISIDISKEDYTVMRLRTDDNGIALFNALQPGPYGITLDNCFRCVASEPTAVIDASEESEIQLVINEFIFHIAMILLAVIIAGLVIGALILRRAERKARLELEAQSLE